MASKSIGMLLMLLMLGATGVLPESGKLALAQSSDGRLAPLDTAIAQIARLEENPNFRRDALYGWPRNLVALSDRWQTVRPRLEALLAAAASSSASSSAVSPAAIASFGKAVSRATLGVSRYTGFTQNETAVAWCGSMVTVGFNDTGSEVQTLVGTQGISAIGYAISSNHGTAFSYLGTPTVAGNSNQTMMGEPSLACADATNFYYASDWSDNGSLRTGIAVAKSTDGGKTFPSLRVAISKDAFGHLIDHGWIAIDHANPSNLYVTYLDLDFSGGVCGTDQFAQPIPRYAIEVIASTDAGATWTTQPAVVEQECANSTSPNVSLAGPQAAVAPSGELYVAWEALGENGGSLLAREIRVARSIDHGATFGAPVTVAPVNLIGDGADLQGLIRASEFPSLAIGIGKANHGFIYLAWSSAGASRADGVDTTGSYGFSDVMFSGSANGGMNWATPIRVNNNKEGGNAPLSDQFKPAIATDKTGRIGICYYDRRRDPNNFLIDRYCASSSNGGASWANRKITPLNYPSLVGQDVLVAPDYMGDYDTVAADATAQAAGFIDAYSSNAPGNPTVMSNKF